MTTLVRGTKWEDIVLKKGKTDEEIRLEEKAKVMLEKIDKNIPGIEYFFNYVYPHVDWEKI